MPSSSYHKSHSCLIRCEKSIKTSEAKKGWNHILLMLRVQLVGANWPASSTNVFKKPRTSRSCDSARLVPLARLMHSDRVYCEKLIGPGGTCGVRCECLMARVEHGLGCSERSTAWLNLWKVGTKGKHSLSQLLWVMKLWINVQLF